MDGKKGAKAEKKASRTSMGIELSLLLDAAREEALATGDALKGHARTFTRKDKRNGIDLGYIAYAELSFDAPLRIAVVNDAERDAYVLDAAMACGELYLGCSDEPIIAVELEDLQKHATGEVYWNGSVARHEEPRPRAAAFLQALIDTGEIVFDIRDESFPFKFRAGSGGLGEYWWEYDGTRPWTPYLASMRDDIVFAVSNRWTGSFITRHEWSRATGGRLSFERAANLIRALSLGKLDIDMEPFAEAKAPTWQKDALELIRFSDNALPDGIADPATVLEKVEALLSFWEAATERMRLSIRLDQEDLDDVEVLTELLRQHGETIGIGAYLDAYAAGTPAEDLLA